MSRILVIFIMLVGGGVGAQTPFTEEAVARGVYFIPSWGHWWDQFGAGLALNDLDNDLDPDLILVGDLAGTVQVLENDGSGYFTDRSEVSTFPISIAVSGVTCADYDGDNDLDIYITYWQEPNRLYRNDGDFLFTDVTNEAGVGDPGSSAGVCWGDYDGDGWLDFYVSNRSHSPGEPVEGYPNTLYRNLGNGTFEEAAVLHGLDDYFMTFQSVFFDHDLDGDLDLYLSTDKGNGVDNNNNRLFRNDDGQFVEISAASGADVHLDSMGLDAADFDRDGDFDLYCTNVTTGNKYLINNADGTYTESADASGVAVYESGWAAIFWDFDNDAYMDLYVANSLIDDSLFTHQGTFPAEDVAGTYEIGDPGWAPGSSSGSYSAAVADLDGDGDLDLAMSAWNTPIAIYINHEGESRHWLRVRPRALAPNRFGVGSTVVVKTGEVEQIQQLKAGYGFKGSSELVLHFGLDATTSVDEIVVRWPNGMLTILTDVAADQTIEIDQASLTVHMDCNRNFVPDYLDIIEDPALDADGDGVIDGCDSVEPLFARGDVNGDGSLDIADSIAALDYLFSTAPIGCFDAADANDDGAVDIGDPIYLLTHLFSLGPAPEMPWPTCGVDPTADGIGCTSYDCN